MSLSFPVNYFEVSLLSERFRLPERKLRVSVLSCFLCEYLCISFFACLESLSRPQFLSVYVSGLGPVLDCFTNNRNCSIIPEYETLS